MDENLANTPHVSRSALSCSDREAESGRSMGQTLINHGLDDLCSTYAADVRVVSEIEAAHEWNVYCCRANRNIDIFVDTRSKIIVSEHYSRLEVVLE